MSAGNTESELRFRLAPEVTAALQAVAREAGRTPESIVESALRRYLAEEGADILAAAKGLAEFDRGESEDFDAVLADVEAILHGKAA